MIEFLDHVALSVQDLQASKNWYSRVLHLDPVQLEEWGSQPIMMQGGTAAVALFQAKKNVPQGTPNIHFAFRITSDSYRSFKSHFDHLGESYYEEDHHHFQSLYLSDPDGYKVELTMLTEKAAKVFSS